MKAIILNTYTNTGAAVPSSRISPITMRASQTLALIFWSAMIFLYEGESPAARAATAVVPSQYENAEGEGANFILSGRGSRILNIYNPSLLSPIMPEGAVINSIAFRMDESHREVFTDTIPDFEIRLSTSPSLAPHIPAPYGSHVGPDELTVHRGPLSFSATPAQSGPNPFHILIPFSKPFTYDPRKGSLAVDVLVHVSTGGDFFVDEGSGGESVSLGNIGQIRGAGIIQIGFEPIPEPSHLAILFLGLGMLFRKEIVYEFNRIFQLKRR